MTMTMTKTGALRGVPWLAMLATTALAAGQSPPRSLIPQEPIAAIVDAFKTHDVVTLGEGPHGNEQGHAFRLALVRDDRFSDVVDDIVVEFGTARYQRVMDEFIAGEPVDPTQLRRAWQDTTVVTSVWDRPIYEEFFRAIRDVNLVRPPEHRVRVLLGDAPIDWRTIKTYDDQRRWGIRKGPHAADLIRKEVIGKRRKALVIWGDSGFQGRRTGDGRMIINILEGRSTRARVFTIATSFDFLAKVHDDARRWPVPSIVSIPGTVIGARPLAWFYPIPPAKGWNTLTMEDTFDALLYFGDVRPTTSLLDPNLCADADYMRMRLGRLALGLPSSIGRVHRAWIDDLKRYCSIVTTRQ
jgi:hypothetical protein